MFTIRLLVGEKSVRDIVDNEDVTMYNGKEDATRPCLWMHIATWRDNNG